MSIDVFVFFKQTETWVAVENIFFSWEGKYLRCCIAIIVIPDKVPVIDDLNTLIHDCFAYYRYKYINNYTDSKTSVWVGLQ